MKTPAFHPEALAELQQQAIFYEERSAGVFGFLLDFSGLDRSRARTGGRAHRGFSDEDRTCVDGEGLGFDVANDFRACLQLDAVSDGDVAVDFSVNHDRASLDLGTNAGVFTDGQIAVRGDFAFNLAVDDEVVGELDGALDLNIRRKDIAGGTAAWARRWRGRSGCLISGRSRGRWL